MKLQSAIPSDVRSQIRRTEFLEKTVRQLEEERSELLVRATVAEEQLKALQQNTRSLVQEYQRKIVELKRRGGMASSPSHGGTSRPASRTPDGSRDGGYSR